MKGMLADGGVLLLASGCAAAFVVVWATIVFSLRRRGASEVLFSLLVLPAAPLAWRAGLRKRAIAMALLAVVYAVVRIAFG